MYPYDDLTSGDRKNQKVSRSTSVRVDRVAKMLHLALIFWMYLINNLITDGAGRRDSVYLYIGSCRIHNWPPKLGDNDDTFFI